MAKIIIPRNPTKILELAQHILDKHNADGESSYLTAVLTEETQQKVAKGLQLDEEAKRLEKLVEKTYGERDKLVKDALKIIKRSRDILKGVFSDALRELGDYGFTVND